MKKLIIFAMIFFTGMAASAKNVDYEEVYRSLEVPTHRYIHDVDPGEYYDTQTSTWSPYPLFRLSSTIYFKSIAIEPGYYVLTPREHEGNWYILFKDSGKVRYIIPVYERDIVVLRTKLKELGTRKPTPQTFLEATDLDHNYLSLVIYWGNYRYYTIFRTIQL